MSNVRLISTDFDGTLIEAGSQDRCSKAFAAALDAHAGRGGLWAINTGRSLEHTLQGLEHFCPPVAPDFLLTNERDVYRQSDGLGWVAHGTWNETCSRRHVELFREVDKFFSFIQGLAEDRPHFTILYENEVPAGLITTTEDVMEDIAREVARESAAFPGLSFQRNTIYLRFCHRDYHKGSALQELCRLEGVLRDEVLAAGDHHNDVSMLDGTHAAMPACPANAIDLVKETVRSAGGYVAESNWADGVAEALEFYQDSAEKRRDGLTANPAS